MFLIFWHFKPRRSYKLGSYKKKWVYCKSPEEPNTSIKNAPERAENRGSPAAAPTCPPQWPLSPPTVPPATQQRGSKCVNPDLREETMLPWLRGNLPEKNKNRRLIESESTSPPPTPPPAGAGCQSVPPLGTEGPRRPPSSASNSCANQLSQLLYDASHKEARQIKWKWK